MKKILSHSFSWNVIHGIDFLWKCIFPLLKIFPINEKNIVFESEGDLSDNAYAFFDFLKENNCLENYSVTWLVEDKKKAAEFARKRNWKRVSFSSKIPSRGRLFSFYFKMATCKYYIYDHCNFFTRLRKRPQQIILNLWHGTPIKDTTLKKTLEEWQQPTYALACSDLAADLSSKFCMINRNKYFVTGYPRNDYFFSTDSNKKQSIKEKLGLENFNKVFLWMPTFRQSANPELNQDYLKNETGLPLLTDLNLLEKFNSFLYEQNILFALKVHHLQADLPVFKSTFSNIKVIKDEMLKEIDVQLYQFIACSDALVTDYSSVAFDYLLTDNPIIYTTDDYDGYAASRGFIVSNTLDYLPGIHVENVKSLENAIIDVMRGIDNYKHERKRICDLFNKYQDGNSSKRIADILRLEAIRK